MFSKLGGFHIFHQIVSFLALVIFQIIDHEVQSCFGENIHEWWKHLHGLCTASENHEIVSQ